MASGASGAAASAAAATAAASTTTTTTTATSATTAEPSRRRFVFRMQYTSHDCMVHIMKLLPDAAAYSHVRCVNREWRDTWSRWAHPPTAMVGALRRDPPDVQHANVLWDVIVEQNAVLDALADRARIVQVVGERAPQLWSRPQFGDVVFSTMYAASVDVLDGLHTFVVGRGIVGGGAPSLCADRIGTFDDVLQQWAKYFRTIGTLADVLQQWAKHFPAVANPVAANHLLFMQRLFCIVHRYLDWGPFVRFDDEYGPQSHVLNMIAHVHGLLRDDKCNVQQLARAVSTSYNGFMDTYLAESEFDAFEVTEFSHFVDQFDGGAFANVHDVYASMQPSWDAVVAVEGGGDGHDEECAARIPFPAT